MKYDENEKKKKNCNEDTMFDNFSKQKKFHMILITHNYKIYFKNLFLKFICKIYFKDLFVKFIFKIYF